MTSSSQPLALIQLISEQTMPNILPVLRLRPTKLVHLVTRRTAVRSACIVEAAREAGQEPDLEIVHLSSMPAMAETFNAVREAIRETRGAGIDPVVNFTGGTKLMSIGAYAAALHRDHAASSLYVDTDDQRFVDGGTGEGLARLLEGDFTFTPLYDRLTVNLIAVANGRESVTAGRNWRPLAPLARHLLDHPTEEQSAHDAVCGKDGILDQGKAPRSPEDWLAAVDREFHLPAEVARLAAEAGLVRHFGAGACRLPEGSRQEMEALCAARTRHEQIPDYDRRRVAATEGIQHSLNFLTGAWWEVIVADAVDRCGLFRDLHWSASVGERFGASLEEDLLAVDGVQIALFSCKRGGEKSRLLPHLEELQARARSIGGQFTRRFLAVYRRPSRRVWDSIVSRARQLGTTVLSADDLKRPDVFLADVRR